MVDAAAAAAALASTLQPGLNSSSTGVQHSPKDHEFSVLGTDD